MPTQHEITEALRGDPEFQTCTDTFLLLSLLIAHGEQSEAAGVPFGVWLHDVKAMIEEPIT